MMNVFSRNLPRRIARVLSSLVVFTLCAGAPAMAATLTVTSRADDGTPGTLRSVIGAANPGDIITFGVTGTIALALGSLDISKSLTISGPGASSLSIDGSHAYTVIVIEAGSVVTISGVTLTNGHNPNPGGFGWGGGVLNRGTLTLTDVTLSGNYAPYGGAIFNYSNSSGLIVRNSTLSGNSADYGGAIWNNPNALATVVSSTFSGNSATNDGGGIANNDGFLSISFSTFSGNVAAQGGALAGPYTVKNTLLANSLAGGNCRNLSARPSISAGHNISDDTSCSAYFTASGDLNAIPAGLDPSGLQDNGGPTQSLALLAGGPAVDAIPLNACTDAIGGPVSTDQRGVARPQASACDIGAFEYSERQKDQTITFGPLSDKQYGDLSLSIVASATSGLPVTFTATGECSLSDAVITLRHVGSCSITASQAGNASYNAAPSVTRTFSIAPAPLTITATNQTTVYGAPLPAFAVSYSGFVNGDTPATLTVVPIVTTGATATSPVGTYAIIPAGAIDRDYVIAYVSGTLTVTYEACLLYDSAKVAKSGSTIPIKMRLCSSSGANQSSSAIVVTAVELRLVPGSVSGVVEDAGHANPDDNFRFDAMLGGYVFNLSTKGLAPGVYELVFRVLGDPLVHGLSLQVQ